MSASIFATATKTALIPKSPIAEMRFGTQPGWKRIGVWETKDAVHLMCANFGACFAVQLHHTIRSIFIPIGQNVAARIDTRLLR
jgi:hypothetical protein